MVLPDSGRGDGVFTHRPKLSLVWAVPRARGDRLPRGASASDEERPGGQTSEETVDLLF